MTFHRTMFMRGVFSLLVFIAAISFLFFDTSSPQPRVVAEDTSQETCILTPEILGGQGFTVSGLGFTVSGLGFTVSGLGFTVSGLGFTVSGLGLDPEQVAQEIRDNPISNQWLADLRPDITGGAGFNTVKTAVLIVDDFSIPEAHGNQVLAVFNDLGNVVDVSNITLVPIDVSGQGQDYRTDRIAAQIENAIEGDGGLLDQGYQHFVINLSFGLIPCSDDGMGEMPSFNFDNALEAIEAANEPQPVRPILECVVDRGYHKYTAYFGYLNENNESVSIPIGNDNKFSPHPKDRNQPRVFESGRQEFVFSVDFQKYDTLVWTLEGPDGEPRTATANKYAVRCDPDDVPSHPTHKVVPILECVADIGDNQYLAYFGYDNTNSASVTIPVGGHNKFTPGPVDKGQTNTFLPGIHEQVFAVLFNGNQIKWEIKGPDNVRRHVYASKDDEPCALDNGYGLLDYLGDQGISDDMVDDYVIHLVNSVDDDSELDGLRGLLQRYLSWSATSNGEFAVFPTASAGNYRPWLGAVPLAPARWPELIAVGATLGNNGPLWQFSHDGNVLAPGAGYPIAENSFVAGTSFAAPFVSMVGALWMTYPNACVYDGINPPLVAEALPKNSNAVFTPGGASPLTCYLNQPPTITNPGDQFNYEGDTVELQIEASDPDSGTILSYSASGLPYGLSIGETSGLISGTVAFETAGTYFVTVEVSDGLETVSTEFGWVIEAPAGLEVCYANSVTLYSPGKNKNGTPIVPHRTHPEKALGAPQNNDTENFVSLGFGNKSTTGVLVLDFAPNRIVNEAGHDIRVWETSFGDSTRPWWEYPEAVRVHASQDGETWVYLGKTTDKDQAYDLGSLEWARYIRLTDITDKHKFSNSADGFDVDAVEGFACDYAETEILGLSSNLIESNDLVVEQTGKWTSVETGNASGGSYLYGDNTATLTLVFEGSSVEVNYLTHPELGMFTIVVDEVAIRTITTTSETTTFDNWTVIEGLESGTHILQIVPIDGIVAIDAFRAQLPAGE